MNIIVPVKQVPDLVEELEVNASGTDLDSEWLKYRINEFDDHALEEALQLKEELDCQVTVLALESQDVDKTLYMAAAKGADKLVKVTGDFASASSHQAAKVLAEVIGGMDYDLILTGVQAADDRDGQTGVLLAHYLDVPHVSVVTDVKLADGKAIVRKEYAGGVMGEFEVDLPAVLGIQAARETPRYAPVSRVRRAMKSTSIDEVSTAVNLSAGSSIRKMYKPESGAGAEMLSGSAEEISDQLIKIFQDKGVSI